MLKQKVGVAPSKISTLLFSPQVCPVPKDIFKSHSILTGKVATQRHLKRTLHMLGIALKGTFQLYAFIFESKYSVPFHAVFLSI